MKKVNVKMLSNISDLSDQDNDASDDLEDGILKDSLLKLTSRTFDEISSDEFVGAKLRNINIASQNDIENQYKGVTVQRKSLSDLDSSNGSDGDYNYEEDDECNVSSDDDSKESNIDYSSENEDYSFGSDEIESSDKRNQGHKLQRNISRNSNLEDDESEDTTPYDIYSKRTVDNVTEDVEKGIAVRNQILIWESLLECRIKLQKALAASNRLPQLDSFSSFSSKCPQKVGKELSKTCRDVAALLKLLITLQKTIIKLFPDFNHKILNRPDVNKFDDNDDDYDDGKKDTDNESISSSIASGFSDKIAHEKKDETNINVDPAEPPKKLRKLEDFSKELEKIHQDFVPARNEAIKKWNDKTRISSGRIKSSNFSAFEQSTLKQIEQILSDRNRLAKRTQTKRSVYSILGKNDGSDAKEIEHLATEYDPEIFDDDDFYHKILREFIEQKSADITNVQQMGKQWAELQKMRSKMKRPIDVKATKGRRLRYTSHSKLVNFVAPIPYNSWTDEAETELFASLFGEIRNKQ